MKTPTEHYKKLRRSLIQARKIVSRVPKDESRTPLQHLKVQSYVFLTHAALEVYLEELALSVCRESQTMFKKEGLITKALVALISSKVIDDIGNKAKNSISSELAENIEVFSDLAAKRFYGIVSSNHGIKISNQTKLLNPIGVNPEKIDVVLMNNLDTFGQARGDVAHTFSAIRNDITVSSVESQLRTIFEDLKIYDAAACSCLSIRMAAHKL